MNRTMAPYLIAVISGLAAFGLHLAGPFRGKPVRAETITSEITPIPQPQAIRKNPDPAQVMELPPSERVLISGDGALDSASYFNCRVTNLSSWTVTELQFRIAAGQPEGSTRWERNYREYVNLPPRTASRISFKVTDGSEAETRWKIIGARGVPCN